MFNRSTELQRDVVAEIKEFYKAEIGRFNISEHIVESRFDKKKFGKKCSCGFCNKSFNPFSLNTLQVLSEWSWAGNGQEAQKKYRVHCPKCEKELRFTMFIEQE